MAATVLRLSPVVFALSVCVHFATFVPGVAISMGWVWPLHVAVIAVFAAMFFVARPARDKKQNEDGATGTWRQRVLRTVRTVFSNRGPSFGEFWASVLRWVPVPVIVLSVATLIYTFLNASVFLERAKSGSAVEENGNYFLKRSGQTVRNLDRNEFDLIRTYEVRGFSGHWMLFALIPTVFSIFVYPHLSEHGVADVSTGAFKK
jgi:hypothetical protein